MPQRACPWDAGRTVRDLGTNWQTAKLPFWGRSGQGGQNVLRIGAARRRSSLLSGGLSLGTSPPNSKLVGIDLQPYATTQAPERSDILNVGGFSDAVFSVVASFLADDNGRFVAEVEKVEL